MKLSKKGEYEMKAPVIRALDGPLAPISGSTELRQLAQRSADGQRGLYAVLLDVHEAVTGILDRTTLADVLRRNDER